MSKIVRPKAEDTHFFEGVDFFAKLHVAFLILFWGTVGFVVVDLVITPFFWWVARLIYLYEKPELTQSYEHEPPEFLRREKQHAFCAAACFAIAVACGAAWHFGVPKLLIGVLLSTVGYISLTVVYYLKAREDPHLYGWH